LLCNNNPVCNEITLERSIELDIRAAAKIAYDGGTLGDGRVKLACS